MENKQIYYTGIGSRETPDYVIKFFIKIGKNFAQRNYILRSGGAGGADSAFEIGCDMVNGKKEIYLPWKGFQESKSDLIVNDPEAFEIAKKFHPYWQNLSFGAKKLHARNSHQILGKDLNIPSNFVICYTKEGKGGGGTGQALRIAIYYNIPIFDAGLYTETELLKEFKIFIKNINNNGNL